MLARSLFCQQNWPGKRIPSPVFPIAESCLFSSTRAWTIRVTSDAGIGSSARNGGSGGTERCRFVSEGVQDRFAHALETQVVLKRGKEDNRPLIKEFRHPVTDTQRYPFAAIIGLQHLFFSRVSSRTPSENLFLLNRTSQGMVITFLNCFTVLSATMVTEVE